MRAVIFGGGVLGHDVYYQIEEQFDDIMIVDNNFSQVRSKFRIHSPAILKEVDFDRIFVAAQMGAESIYIQLIEEFGVDEEKIDRSYVRSLSYQESFSMRNIFLRRFADYVSSKSLRGSVAEVGVYRGDFARKINQHFSNKRLYLFDTFDGFDEKDLAIEFTVNKNLDSFNHWYAQAGNHSNTSVQIVIDKLPHPEKAVIKKGRFPETFDLKDETFFFVNLDTDLHQPTKAGLEIFYPLMERGGVILVHDYNASLHGVLSAVDEFVARENALAIPIGDVLSLAIVKQ